MGDADKIAKLRTAVETGTAVRIDGVMVDITTAHAIVTVHDRLNERNRATLAAKSIGTMARIAWGCLRGK
jgi:hypothetical protein